MNRTCQFVTLVAAGCLVATASASFTFVHASAARPAAKAGTHDGPSTLRTVPHQYLQGSDRVRTSGLAHLRTLQQQQHRLPVLFPLAQGCTFQPLTLPPNAPAGAATATLSQVPSDLSESAGVEYPPCPGDPSNALTTPEAPGSIIVGIPSVTRYTGSAGTVFLTVNTPSAAAVSYGLYLGDPAGSLPDGTQLYAMNAQGPPGDPSNFVEWWHDGVIIIMSSPDLSNSDLEALASSVSVRLRSRKFQGEPEGRGSPSSKRSRRVRQL